MVVGGSPTPYFEDYWNDYEVFTPDLSGQADGTWQLNGNSQVFPGPVYPDGRIPDLSGNGHTGELSEGAELTPSDAPIDLMDSRPVLSVSANEVNVGPAPTVTFVSIGNAGGGVLSWSLSEQASWLRVASFFGDSEDGSLAG